jgi:hypothetical protein
MKVQKIKITIATKDDAKRDMKGCIYWNQTNECKKLIFGK